MPFDIKNVSFYYRSLKALDRLSISILPGKFYGVIGPNGCGKTTFLDLLVKHRSPGEGEILFNGKPLGSYSKKELAKEIALAPQEFGVNFSYKAKEIVLMGRHPHIPRFAAPGREDFEILETVMESTDTARFKDRYITELSGGERQRVLFARALAQDTSVLLLDEATSNLDINHALTLLNIAAKRVADHSKTVIAVFHDINLAASFCDHLIFMKGGGIPIQGATQEVLTGEAIREIFEVDSKVFFDPYSNSKKVIFKR